MPSLQADDSACVGGTFFGKRLFSEGLAGIYENWSELPTCQFSKP